MPAKFRHFSIHADDVQRAKAFYEAVCGWTFTPWGPPNFYQLLDLGGGFVGALQQRQEPLTGTGMRGFEVTLGVDDLDATLDAVSAHGGEILTQRYRIEGVGELAYFADTEGNRVGAMQYDPGRWD